MIKVHLTSIKSKKKLNRRNDHEIFIVTLELHEHSSIKISEHIKASNNSYEKDKNNWHLCTSNTNLFLQQNLSTNTQDIMILMHRDTLKDSKTSRFAFF